MIFPETTFWKKVFVLALQIRIINAGERAGCVGAGFAAYRGGRQAVAM